MRNRKNPVLYIIVPCYNEQEVLPITGIMFLKKIKQLREENKIGEKSKVVFVNDGSRDDTWNIICKFSKENTEIEGINLSRNRGHQNAVLAGLMEVKDRCDVTITIDCDGQDDIHAMDKMIEEYHSGCEVVYGVRNNRDTDTFFKRATAEGYYRILKIMGAEVVFNHADYRLLSSRVLQELAKFKEVNIYLRGMIPLVGFKSTCVYYKRYERKAGESHYPLKKMLALAFDGITSLSIKPIRVIMSLGMVIAFLSFIGVIWSVVIRISGNAVSGWASMTCLICFLGGIQLISLGVLGEYIGKIYMETKGRPRYLISEKTYEEENI